MRKIGRLLVVAALGLGAPITGAAAPCAGFSDVDDSSGFCTSIAWVKNRGITLGCTTTSLYCPTSFVTREQMAAFLYRLGFNNAFLQGGNAFGATAVIGTTDNQAVDVRAFNERAARFEYAPVSPNVLLGHSSAGVYTGVHGATIAGGGSTRVNATCTSGFGCVNGVTDHFGTVGGGEANKAGDLDGDVNNSRYATVGGGFNNRAAHYASTVAGGYANTASGPYSAVLGGAFNTASGTESVVLGGTGNTASGGSTIAGGSFARAIYLGCMVLGDYSSVNDVSCGAANQFIVRAVGGTYLFTGGSTDATYTGVYVGPGSGAWAVYSDRGGKEEINAVDPVDVAKRLATVPMATWQWKAEPNRVRHIGPMAQDFHAAFGLGASDRHISTVDADGVALAAVQGVYKLVQQKDADIEKLRSESAELKRELAELRTAQHREVAELRLAIEALMARTSAEGRVAQSP